MANSCERVTETLASMKAANVCFSVRTELTNIELWNI